MCVLHNCLVFVDFKGVYGVLIGGGVLGTEVVFEVLRIRSGVVTFDCQFGEITETGLSACIEIME